MSFLPLVRIWIWVSVLASAAGWLLSALGQLNQAGYAILGAVVVVGLWVGRTVSGGAPAGRIFNWRKLRSRFRRWLPASFAGLAFLVFLGAALYPPTTHEGLTCRVPRVLHWLAEGHWHWITTPNARLNDRPCGLEWLAAPLLLFTRSDRGLFLINFIPLLLLPGLIFSVFTRLGVRPRVAWHWMWLLPTGYNFLLQSGSLGNDTTPAFYALAAVDFGLRAWTSRRPADLWLSILSAAFLTATKVSDLPLLLPWAVVVFPLLPRILHAPVAADGSRRKLSAAKTAPTPIGGYTLAEHHARGETPWLIRQLAATLAVVVLAASVSFLPTAAFNIHYGGDWAGLAVEHSVIEMKHPLVGLWGNTLLLLKNFAPPIFPLAGWWNQSALTILPHSLVAPMVANFEPGFHTVGELPIEDAAGLGFGVSFLLVVSVIAAWWVRPSSQPRWVGNRCIPVLAAAVGAGGAVDFVAGLFHEGRDDGPAAPSVRLLPVVAAVAAGGRGAGGDRAAPLVARAGGRCSVAGRPGSGAGAGPPVMAGPDHLVPSDRLETQSAAAPARPDRL